MTVSSFYPDAHVESTSVDGEAGRTGNEVWATIRGGAGTQSGDSTTTTSLRVRCSGTTNQFDLISRCVFLFDTSAIPGADDISAGVLNFAGNTGKVDDFTDSLSLVTTTPDSNTAVVNGDYSQFGTTKQANDILVSGITTNKVRDNTFTLNAAGLTSISKTSVTKFGMRTTIDNDDDEPTYGSGDNTTVNIWTAEEDQTGDIRPQLTITHASRPTSPGNIAEIMRAIGIL